MEVALRRADEGTGMRSVWCYGVQHGRGGWDDNAPFLTSILELDVCQHHWSCVGMNPAVCRSSSNIDWTGLLV